MFNFLKIFFLFFLFLNTLHSSQNISKNWLEKQPRSYAKDFYIWRYLNQNITPNEAIWALGEARYVNNKLLYRYAKKLNHKETNQVTKCMKSSAKNLLNTNADCIEVGLSTYKATKLSKKELESIITKVQNKYPNSAKRFAILHAPTPFLELLKNENAVFFDTFNQCGGKFRVQHFNHHLPLEVIGKLKNDKKKFAQTIKLIVTNPKLTKIQKSLLNINTKGLEHKTVFFLAINAIKHKKKQIALSYLQKAYKNAYFQFDKDKVLYWQYRLTNDKNFLQQLSNSWDVNLYSLIANELQNKKITNAIFDIKQEQNAMHYDTTNPFAWLKVLRNSKKMNDKKMQNYNKLFTTQETLGHLAFVKERYDRYRNSYFVNPYKEYIKNYPKQRQALINAIARQESRFIPTSISTAYALGVMQIMPFLSKAIAKELKEKYYIDKQLEAKTNILYADHHLDFLEKRLDHPLFIAYAYNGGIGFTRRVLKSGLFQSGIYEPYLSMELIPYDESKRYAKKVLLNYVMYYNNTHEKKIKMINLLQKVKTPYYK